MRGTASDTRPTVREGRRLTALQLLLAHPPLMSTTRLASTLSRPSDLGRPWSGPGRPAWLPDLVVGEGAVVALRRRSVVAPGALESRGELQSDRLVSARDLCDRPWLIPASAVWMDSDVDGRRENPRFVGLATDTCRAARRPHRPQRPPGLGGVGGPQARPGDDPARRCRAHRHGHDLGRPPRPRRADRPHRDQSRQRAGALGGRRQRRFCVPPGAVHGPGHAAIRAASWATSSSSCRPAASVSVSSTSTPSWMKEAGIARVSVQLLVATHDPVRRWDADRVQ